MVSLDQMKNWLVGLLAALALLIAKMKAARLTDERDDARADAKAQSRKAEVKAHEADVLQKQPAREDAIDAADSVQNAAGLDNLFKR